MARFSSRICFLTVPLLTARLAGQEEVLNLFSLSLMFASEFPNLNFAAVDTVVHLFVSVSLWETQGGGAVSRTSPPWALPVAVLCGAGKCTRGGQSFSSRSAGPGHV